MFRLHYAPDNASLVVRLVLEEMGLAYETVLVDRSRAEQTSAAYRKLNPRGLIPVMETPSGPIFETAAILLYLTETSGRMAPPPGSPGRPGFLSWLFALSNGLQTDLAMRSHPDRYGGPETMAQAAVDDAAIVRIRQMLTDLNALACAGHDWFAGEEPTALDFYAAVLLRWFALYPMGGTQWFHLPDWPALAQLATRLETRPAVARAQEAEGLGPTPFSAPVLPNPPEGSTF